MRVNNAEWFYAYFQIQQITVSPKQCKHALSLLDHLFNTGSIPIYVNVHVFNRLLTALHYVQKHVLCQSYKALSLNIWTIHIFSCYSEPALNWCQHECYVASPCLKSYVLLKSMLRFGCGNPATVLNIQQNETDTWFHAFHVHKHIQKR